MLTLEERHDWLRAISPTNLRLVAAIRGYAVAVNDAGYTYAMLNCGEGLSLIALAASNPEGVFFGFEGDADKLAQAASNAAEWGVDNVKFVQADAAALSEALQSGALKPAFNYVVANLSDSSESDLTTAIALSGNLAAPGGVCYAAYNVSKATATSQSAYVEAYSAGSTNTDKAHSAAAGTQLAYIGSAKIKFNYLEFSVKPDLQPRLIESHGTPVYENLKDFAIGSRLRHDVWIKPGALQTDNVATLWGAFSFGMAAPSSYVDPQFKYFDKKLDLTTPLFTRLLATLSETPHSIGDMIAHAEFKSAAQNDLVAGVQMLVATGIVEATRGGYFMSGSDFEHPQFSTSFNQRLRDEGVTEEGALLAAPMLGRPVLGTAPMVMTMQSLDQGGLKGAEEHLDQMLQAASPAIKEMFGTTTDLSDKEVRRNIAYGLLEQMVSVWLQFCYVNGILQPR